MSDSTDNLDNKPERISVRHMFDALLSAFNLERGLGYTLKELLIHPKKAVSEYLFEDRKRMVHPLRFLFFTTAIAAFINLQFVMNEEDFTKGATAGSSMYEQEIADESLDSAKTEERNRVVQQAMKAYFRFLTDYQNLLLLVFVPIAAFSSWLFFRKRKLYFGEHLALNSYAVGFQNLIYMATLPLLTLHSSFTLVYFGLSMLYLLYFYIVVFDTEGGQPVVAAAIGASFTSYVLYITLLIALVIGLVVYVTLLEPKA
jgi:hypothetical protein